MLPAPLATLDDPNPAHSPLARSVQHAIHDDQDARQVLLDGQTAVHWLLTRFALMDRGGPGIERARDGLVRRLCAELAVHLQVEEELLYPRLRAAMDDASLIDQAEIEHECVRELMERLMETPSDDAQFTARVMVLAEIFDLHVQRELTQLLPLLQGPGLAALGEHMSQRRDDLLAEIADSCFGQLS